MTSQQRGTRGSHREEQSTVVHDQSPDRTSVDQDEGQPEHIRRDMLRMRGRQALIDLLVRVERERQGELHGLTEYPAVFDFAHRNRIQSLLRGRFLRNERHVEEERLPSMAASELVQLRQHHTVSGLRYILTISLGIIFYFPVICSILCATLLVVSGQLAGVAIGSTVLLNAMFAGPICGASMNPARSIGPAIVWNEYKGLWVYILGPIVGAAGGALVYNSLRVTDKGASQQ